MKRSSVFLVTTVALFIYLLTVCTTNTQASTGVSLVLLVTCHFSVCLVSTLALRATPVTGSGPPKKQVILVCSSDRKPIATENHLRKQQGTIRIRGFPLSVNIVHIIICWQEYQTALLTRATTRAGWGPVAHSYHHVLEQKPVLTAVVLSSKALTMAGTSRGLQLPQASCPIWLSPKV